MKQPLKRLSFFEKAGYSAADAASNFVFMTMILFQLNFYTDVFGLTASAAATVLLWPRLWDAFFDPIMGLLADRTNTRWGKFRPWILWTAVPWAIMMVLAYTTPQGMSKGFMVVYATLTNMFLMTLYSMNNMPYSALGGVITADLNERAKLNSFRFIAVNIAQFIVGGFTLPLVAKFSAGHNRQFGWQMTMVVWAVLCLVLFMTTFLSTRERIKPISQEKSSPAQDFRSLVKNAPWIVMVFMTLVHFAMLSFRGGALYNYYHHFADKTAMFNFLNGLGLVAAEGAPSGGLLDMIGYRVHGGLSDLANSNVADVFNSIINMLGTAITITVILLSPSLAARFGKKAVGITGFALSTINAFAFYLLGPTNTTGMVVMTITGSMLYAPTIPLIWAMFADVADYSEWQTGRRFTGIVFATIGFALKAGLAFGSASFLWIMAGMYGYETNQPSTANAIAGYRACAGVVVGLMFATCTVLLSVYKLNKKTTLDMAADLEDRRQKAAAQIKTVPA
jgi:GPH family glycoside/pentoside/hexuronide:cation symporter